MIVNRHFIILAAASVAAFLAAAAAFFGWVSWAMAKGGWGE